MMKQYEIVSFWFDEFVECVWKLRLHDLQCTFNAYNEEPAAPNRAYPKGSQISGQLSLNFVRVKKALREDEKNYQFVDLFPHNTKESSGSLVKCVGKISRSEGLMDYELSCGTKLILNMDEKINLESGDWVEVTGNLYFDPDFSTLVIPPENAPTVE